MHTLVKRGTWLGCLLLITALVACSGTAEAETCNPGETVEDCAQRVCSCPNTCDFACLENTSCSTTCNETHLNQVGENDYECHCEETTCRIGGNVPCDDSSGGGDSGGGDSGGGDSGGGGLPSYEELLSGRVRQSSTAWDGDARRAVDGNQDGNYWAGSVTHTDINVRPEWHIYTYRTRYKSVTIYNRTDCCGERLAGASVWVHHDDGKGGYIWRRVATIGKNPGSKIHISFYGKLPNHNADALAITLPEGSKVPLSLAEVQLWGCGGPGHRCWE
jgi:hypothetical protein